LFFNQLITKPNEQYEGIAMLLQQIVPLPDFCEAQSKLILKETCNSYQASHAAAGLLAFTNQSANNTNSPQNRARGGKFSNRGRVGSGRRGRGRGRGYSRGRGSNYYNETQTFYGPNPIAQNA
jgi:hypothetical protein